MTTTDRILGESVRPPTEKELTDPYCAYAYATDVLNGRWPEGEAAIATEPQCAKEYLEMCPEARLGWAMRGWIPLEDAWGI